MHSWQTGEFAKILGDRKEVGVTFHTSNQDQMYQVGGSLNGITWKRVSIEAMRTAIPISLTAKAIATGDERCCGYLCIIGDFTPCCRLDT